jgi:hypothetical protein
MSDQLRLNTQEEESKMQIRKLFGKLGLLVVFVSSIMAQSDSTQYLPWRMQTGNLGTGDKRTVLFWLNGTDEKSQRQTIECQCDETDNFAPHTYLEVDYNVDPGGAGHSNSTVQVRFKFDNHAVEIHEWKCDSYLAARRIYSYDTKRPHIPDLFMEQFAVSKSVVIELRIRTLSGPPSSRVIQFDCSGYLKAKRAFLKMCQEEKANFQFKPKIK